MIDYKMIGTEYFHGKIAKYEQELQNIHDYLKKLDQELQINFRKFWMLDEKFGDIIVNVNNTLEILSRKSQTRFIMSESYRFPPILIRRIELFGIESLTMGELQTIKEIHIVAYIDCLISEKFPTCSEINHTDMKLKIDNEDYSFYYKRVSWSGFQRLSSPNREIITNVKTTNTLIDIIHTSVSIKHRRCGVLIIPEVEIEIIKY